MVVQLRRHERTRGRIGFAMVEWTSRPAGARARQGPRAAGRRWPLNPGSALWIDLVTPTVGDIGSVESVLGMELPSRQEAGEIEVSSRLYAEEARRVHDPDVHGARGRASPGRQPGHVCLSAGAPGDDTVRGSDAVLHVSAEVQAASRIVPDRPSRSCSARWTRSSIAWRMSWRPSARSSPRCPTW